MIIFTTIFLSLHVQLRFSLYVDRENEKGKVRSKRVVRPIRSKATRIAILSPSSLVTRVLRLRSSVRRVKRARDLTNPPRLPVFINTLTLHEFKPPRKNTGCRSATVTLFCVVVGAREELFSTSRDAPSSPFLSPHKSPRFLFGFFVLVRDRPTWILRCHDPGSLKAPWNFFHPWEHRAYSQTDPRLINSFSILRDFRHFFPPLFHPYRGFRPSLHIIGGSTFSLSWKLWITRGCITTFLKLLSGSVSPKVAPNRDKAYQLINPLQ